MAGFPWLRPPPTPRLPPQNLPFSSPRDKTSNTFSVQPFVPVSVNDDSQGVPFPHHSHHRMPSAQASSMSRSTSMQAPSSRYNRQPEARQPIASPDAVPTSHNMPAASIDPHRHRHRHISQAEAPRHHYGFHDDISHHHQDHVEVAHQHQQHQPTNAATRSAPQTIEPQNSELQSSAAPCPRIVSRTNVAPLKGILKKDAKFDRKHPERNWQVDDRPGELSTPEDIDVVIFRKGQRSDGLTSDPTYVPLVRPDAYKVPPLKKPGISLAWPLIEYEFRVQQDRRARDPQDPRNRQFRKKSQPPVHFNLAFSPANPENLRVGTDSGGSVPMDESLRTSSASNHCKIREPITICCPMRDNVLETTKIDVWCNGNPILVVDVFQAIFEAYQRPVTNEEVNRIGPSYLERCRPHYDVRCHDLGLRRNGDVWRRIDLLRGQRLFKGLKLRQDHESWDLLLEDCSSARPTNSMQPNYNIGYNIGYNPMDYMNNGGMKYSMPDVMPWPRVFA